MHAAQVSAGFTEFCAMGYDQETKSRHHTLSLSDNLKYEKEGPTYVDNTTSVDGFKNATSCPG